MVKQIIDHQHKFESGHKLEQDQNIDAVVYNWIKLGYNSVEELVKLKNDHEMDIVDVVETLKRLKEYDLIKIKKDKVILNGMYDL